MLGWDSEESPVETVETKRVYIVGPSNLRTLPTYHPCNRFKVVWIEEIKGKGKKEASPSLCTRRRGENGFERGSLHQSAALLLCSY